MTGEKPLPLEPALVNEFVLKAHGDLGVVKQLLEEEPALLNAAWDWGGGDWETGLGAASHVGRRDIAEFLLERRRAYGHLRGGDARRGRDRSRDARRGPGAP